ncbi:putative membrane protein C6F6.13c [Ceratocystis fimbriata CBS 114723]|uniref:Putative membrane protein C6F6.13c n=1 Tax=Ceratocystis fimbriata CBS 114723 TaxID=1035309 RepID=A0A2C5WX49_9PEZI|nr:putative membrane protein C6F6.13c [Ceratocystis fimbriata CBS 114723]
MARGRGGFGGGRRPVCLTGIISGGERDDLVNLLVTVTDVMATNMGSVFQDPSAMARSARSALEMSQKENLPPKPIDSNRNSSSSLNGSFSTSTSASATATEDEDMPVVLSELKKEMLTFFRKWQSALINRTRDLEANNPLPSPATSDTQISGRSRAGKGRPGRNSGHRVRNSMTGPKSTPVGSRTVQMIPGPVCAPSMQQTDPGLRRFQPIPTPLWSLPVERRRLLQNIAFLMILSLEDYSAYGRTAMMYLTSSLNLSLRSVQEDEVRIGRCLGKISVEFALGEMARRIEEGAEMPRGRQTGSNRADDSEFLAGPISNSTLGRCMDSVILEGSATIELLGQLGDNGVAMGSLFAFYGARATGKTIEAYSKDIQDFALIPTHGKANKGEPLMDTRDLHPHDYRLRMTFCVNGSLMGEDKAASDAWNSIGAQAEVYSLRWETNSLRSLATCLEMISDSRGWMEAKQYFTKNSIHDAFTKSEWPSCLERLSKIIDNPWTVGMVRADKVGLVLADIILRKVQGGRPISLVGYGLGARSIYTCLMTLAERRQFGLIESVLMMGCPAPSCSLVWVTMKSVVNGRLINAYSSSDCMMPFMYRLSDPKFGLAGIEAIKNVPNVENYDVGDLPSGYMRYQYMTGKILQQVGWEDVDHEAVANEAVKLMELDQKYAPQTVVTKPIPNAPSAAAVAPLVLKQLKSSALNEGRDPSLRNIPRGFTITPSANTAPLTITTNSRSIFPPTMRPSHDGVGIDYAAGHSRNRSSSSTRNLGRVSVSGPGANGRSTWNNGKSHIMNGSNFNDTGRGPRRTRNRARGASDAMRDDSNNSGRNRRRGGGYGNDHSENTSSRAKDNYSRANDEPGRERRSGGGGRRRGGGGMGRSSLNQH